MGKMPGLLYPALHKFYSALSHLEEFEKGKDFFENITHLDAFFSEYRNITFVLQKSLKGSLFVEVYETLRDKYLINDTGKWFVEKRNEVLKQQPFDLEKKIVITIYSGEYHLTLPERVFTIENDVAYASIIDELQSLFRQINPIEVMFSAEFFFNERGEQIELYENFISGIDQMRALLKGLKEAINETCELCDKLETKINSFNFYKIPKNFLFIDDYIYFCKEGRFEKGSRSEFMMDPPPLRLPIKNFFKRFQMGKTPDLFKDFALMHVIIFQMQKRIMPTIFIIYDDETISMHSFEGSIKTTVYRKFYEVAKRVKLDGIQKVLYVAEMVSYTDKVIQNPDFINMDSKERSSLEQSGILSLFMLSKDLSHKMMSFETDKIDDMKYITGILNKPEGFSGYFRFLNSVISEFKKINSEKKD